MSEKVSAERRKCCGAIFGTVGKSKKQNGLGLGHGFAVPNRGRFEVSGHRAKHSYKPIDTRATLFIFQNRHGLKVAGRAWIGGGLGWAAWGSGALSIIHMWKTSP